MVVVFPGNGGPVCVEKGSGERALSGEGGVKNSGGNGSLMSWVASSPTDPAAHVSLYFVKPPACCKPPCLLATADRCLAAARGR